MACRYADQLGASLHLVRMMEAPHCGSSAVVCSARRVRAGPARACTAPASQPVI